VLRKYSTIIINIILNHKLYLLFHPFHLSFLEIPAREIVYEEVRVHLRWLNVYARSLLFNIVAITITKCHRQNNATSYLGFYTGFRNYSIQIDILIVKQVRSSGTTRKKTLEGGGRKWRRILWRHITSGVAMVSCARGLVGKKKFFLRTANKTFKVWSGNNMWK